MHFGEAALRIRRIHPSAADRVEFQLPLSRARLQLLHFGFPGTHTECAYIVRLADRWDRDLPVAVGKRNASMQALVDAVAVRQLLFRVVPTMRSATHQIYRPTAAKTCELVISGDVTREAYPPASVRSLAMRAKLFGFRFWLDESVLEPLESEKYAVNSY